MFNSLEKAIQWMIEQPKFKEHTTLETMHEALIRMRIDLGTMKKIHVAGTNGKGSTASYITHILMAEGLKVGTYTSPYLKRFNERIRLNFVMIDDDTLLQYIQQMYTFNDDLYQEKGYKLSFFEMMTLIALRYFQDQAVDVIVMEVGIGGLLDATNALSYDVSIITSIGFDHMKQLGYTLPDIAKNKLGIVKEKGHLISAVDKELKPQFIEYCKEKHASYTFIKTRDIMALSFNQFSYKGHQYRISLLGNYQRSNACIAIETVKYLYPNIDQRVIEKGLEETKWPGRFEKIGPNTYIDGAHNVHAIEALAQNMHYLFHHQKVTVLFSALADKDIKAMLDILMKRGFDIVLTAFEDVRYESLEPLAKDLNVSFVLDPIAFIKTFEHEYPDHILMITGSLHFIGDVLNHY